MYIFFAATAFCCCFSFYFVFSAMFPPLFYISSLNVAILHTETHTKSNRYGNINERKEMKKKKRKEKKVMCVLCIPFNEPPSPLSSPHYSSFIQK